MYDGLPEPIRVGYTFVAWTINGIEVNEDTAVSEHMAGRTLVAKWKGDEYDLIIHYVYEDGTKAFDSQNKKVEYGTDYSVNSPDLRGHTPDITVVSGTMVAQNVVYTVTYVANEYTLTINYLFSADNGKVSEPYVAVLKHGESYSVNSPSVGGHECLEPVVSGTIDISDVVVNVYYYSTVPDISVTIEWGDLIFDFSHDDWDPETHDYPGDTYTPSTEESNKITITNNSSISINADLEFIPQTGFESITGGFTEDPDSSDTVNSVNVPSGESDDVYLHIQGNMPIVDKSQKQVMVGSCKVTIRGGQQ